MKTIRVEPDGSFAKILVEEPKGASLVVSNYSHINNLRRGRMSKEQMAAAHLDSARRLCEMLLSHRQNEILYKGSSGNNVVFIEIPGGSSRERLALHLEGGLTIAQVRDALGC